MTATSMTGEDLKAAGTALVLAAAAPWAERAAKYVEGLAPGALLTSEDVIDRVGLPTAADNRAVGALMLSLYRRSVLIPTGDYVRAVRPERHSGVSQVWRRA